MIRTAARIALGLALVAIGASHFRYRRGFARLVPPWATRVTKLDDDAIVLASGAAEAALGVGLIALPRERQRIGWLTAALFVAVFPGNVHQWRTRLSAPGLDTDARRFARLFLQPALVAWALWSTSERRA